MIVLFAAYLLFSVGGLVLFKLGTSCTAVPFSSAFCTCA